MKFIADLHIHSRFSMATARSLDFEHLHISAQLKGITVVGTGDITHPGWFAEMEEKLVPAEPGLFKLNNRSAQLADAQVPLSCHRPVRFLLSAEIGNVYKKNGLPRKNHNLVFLPDIHTAAAFNKRLEKQGDISADGRPVLSLDAKNLLEIVLESSDKAFLIPAHIWTPWFSLLGSKSGFNSIEECFEELAEYIFAVETGLSSDPPMNWRVSSLDNRTLVSNSDAHSPDKLGREANLFNTDLSFEGIRSAIKTGDPDQFIGTFEFNPEQGKYHLDGHRKCDVCLRPSETTALKGKCPICGKPLTQGVLNRVEMLSDRPEGMSPNKKQAYVRLMTLSDILSDICQVGPNTKKVNKIRGTLISKFGGEFKVLNDVSMDELDSVDVPLLADAIQKMRLNKVEIMPGYDGRYGKIRIFNNQERRCLMKKSSYFSLPKQKGTLLK
jgi:DNA helicase II / ATP-dependent DNA helicase PcrA